MTDKFGDEDHIESFKFRFLDQSEDSVEPAICLKFTKEETDKLPKGWFVKPISNPCRVSLMITRDV